MKFIKRIAAMLSAAAMVTSLLPVIPASADITDASVTAFRQMRCNNGKSNTVTATGETYYSSGYLIDILCGKYISSGAEATRTNAEIKTSAREYALMRIALNSPNTDKVDVGFSVSAANKSFSAYSYDYADWINVDMTDYNHVPTSNNAVNITYAASAATGYDWSQKGFTFDAVNAIATDTSESDKLIEYSFSVSDEENAAGYKDIMIVNTTSESDATYIMVGEPTVTTALKSEPTEEPTIEPTEEPTAEPTEEPTAMPTAEPTVQPLQKGAIQTVNQPSNVTTEQSVTVDEYGNKRDAAYTTNNNSIWYLGRYDLSKIESIEMRLGLVANAKTGEMPQVKIAYMPSDNTTVDSEYITNNNSAIRATNRIIAQVEGLTEPTVSSTAGHQWLGAMYTVTDSNVNVNADEYGVFPGGNAKLGENNIPLKTSAAEGEVELFIYATAQSRRAAIDYVIINEKEIISTPTALPTVAPTVNPGETTAPTVTPTATPTVQPTSTPIPAGIPDGAIIVKEQSKTGVASTVQITADANGTKRDTAYSNGTGVWYIGNYELNNIDSIDLRLGLVASTDGTTLPQVRIAYLPLDGSVINDDYLAEKSSTIRGSANRLAVVEGLTEPTANNAAGHQWLGALYTVDANNVTVDSDGYTAFPGGKATVGANSSALKQDAAEGKVALFVYTVASKCRAAIDYVAVHEKVLTPKELKIEGEDTWVIRDNVSSDYETSVDAYKAVLISDIGTEMKYEASEILWSVEGSDYISMKSVSGSNSAMTADKNIPIGKQTITLKAEYESESGIMLTAQKTITVEKRESSVPKAIAVSGAASLDLLRAQLPYTESYSAEVKDQFGTIMENSVVGWCVEGDNFEGISINNGVLTIADNASSSAVTIKAYSVAAPEISTVFNVNVIISEYPSKLYPTDDVLFRKENTASTNVSGPSIEIRNLVDSDRGFSGGLKFDISTVKQAIAAGYPINSISIRLTTSVSRDGKLMLKPLSNDWNELNASENSFDNKQEIINAAIASEELVTANGDEGVFTLNRRTNGKGMHEGERGDTEGISDYQTTLDITSYIKNYISNNPDANEMSLLLMPYYNGTNSNTIFSKDIDNTYSNYSALVTKFPELNNNLSELYPVILIDYGKETVTIESGISALPIPISNAINSTILSATHYNPFTGENDKNITWSVSAFTDLSGNETEPTGISIDENGVLSVTKEAHSGTVTVRAVSSDNKLIYAEASIKITSLVSQLANGSFERTDDANMPLYWSSNDPLIDASHNGTQQYVMDQASENVLSNFLRTNDTDGYLSGTHSAEDPTGIYGKKTVKLTGAHGIDKDYEGRVYTNNAANGSSDGGPDLRITPGVSYWLSQDYHLADFYQLNSSAMAGPYIGYEGFQGTTSKSTQFSNTWYIKDGSASSAYTTNGYDTVQKLITVPQNVNRLRINWGLTSSEGSIYYHNFRLAPQGIDTSKKAVDGKNVLKVTGSMDWTSDSIAVSEGSSYTYKFSSLSETSAAGAVTISFFDAEGTELNGNVIDIPPQIRGQKRQEQ